MESASNKPANVVRRYHSAILAFFIAFVPFLIFSLWAGKTIRDEAELQFNSLANHTAQYIQGRANDYLYTFLGVRAFFDASQTVEPAEWDLYIKSVQRFEKYPGLIAICYAPRVPGNELDIFQSGTRKILSNDYTIVPVGNREVYFPILYLTYFQKGYSLKPGIDLYTNPVWKAEMDKSAMSGFQHITAKTFITTEDGVTQAPALIVFTPIYNNQLVSETRRKEALKGFIVSFISPEKFFPEVIQGAKLEYINYAVYEGMDFSPERLLASTMPAVEGKSEKQAKFRRDEKWTFANRVFGIRYESTPAFEAQFTSSVPSLVSVSGGIIALLVAYIVGYQVRAKTKLRGLLEQLRKSEESLKAANEQLKKENAEKVEALKELAYEQRLLDELMSNIPDAVYFKDKESRFIRCSPGARRKTGLTEAQMIGKTDRDLFTSEHSEEALRDEQEIMRTGKPIINKIEKETWLDGHVTWVLTTKMPFRDKDGNIIGTYGISKDITELKLVQEELAQEKELLAVTINSIGDAVISTDLKGNIVLMNKVAEELTGWSREEAIGKHLNEVFVIINEQTKKPAPDPVKKVLMTGEVSGLANNTVLVARDGTERVIADSASPIRDQSGKVLGVVLVFRDVTEKRRIEQEVIRSARLESIASLAGGISHDFNNILTAIMGNISLAKMMLNPDQQAYQLLEHAEQSCVRAKGITRQLLTFTSSGSPLKKPQKLDPILRQAIELAVYGSTVTAEFSISDPNVVVDVDETQLTQAINHLAMFSVKSMPTGGKIFVSTDVVELEEADSAPLQPGSYVRIIIQDHGAGMSKEHISRFFEPYYTHFGPAPGSGLGIAAADAIIRRHNGKVKVYSAPGKGTTFTIYLPLCFAKPQTTQPVTFDKGGLYGKRILLMDDEENICTIAKIVLERDGFVVDTVTDGEQAIKKFAAAKNAGYPYDLVILDLTVHGGVGGKETIEQLKQIDPNVVAIVASGYSFDPIIANHKEYGFVAALQKPYSAKELSRIVLDVMTRKPSS